MPSTTTLTTLLAASAMAATALLSSCGSSDTAATTSAAPEANESFDRFKNQFIDSLWYYNPGRASNSGYHRYDSLLVIPTPARRQVEAAAQARMRKRLMGFASNDLSVNNQTDYQLMLNYLDKSRFYADTLRSWSWDPSSYNLGSSVAEILNGRYHPLDRRLRAISIKIDHASDYYDAAQNNIERPTREHTELAILQNEGGLQVFGAALQDSIKRSGLDAREKKELQDRIATTRLVIENYLKFLRGEVLAGGKFRSFRLGKELFDRKFALDIQSAYSADQIYQKAQNNRAYLLRDMGRRAARLWPKYFAGRPVPTDSVAMIKQVISRLSEKHATQAGFVEAVKAQIPQLIKFVNDKKLLTQDPSKPLMVRETPAYMRGSGAGASISAPGPYDKAANTYYNVEPPTNLTPAQAESYLREYNDYTLQILNIHEAIPGHYTQLVYANRSPSLVKSILPQRRHDRRLGRVRRAHDAGKRLRPEQRRNLADVGQVEHARDAEHHSRPRGARGGHFPRSGPEAAPGRRLSGGKRNDQQVAAGHALAGAAQQLLQRLHCHIRLARGAEEGAGGQI